MPTASARGLRAVIVRFFNTVGPRQTGRYGMVIPRFVRQALAGEPLTIFGTGDQIRCFCHVLDVIPGGQALAATPAAYGKAVNLGNTEQTINQQPRPARHRITGSSSDITYASLP